MAFTDDHPDFEFIEEELKRLLRHNIKEDMKGLQASSNQSSTNQATQARLQTRLDGLLPPNHPDTRFLISEGAVVLIVLERFLRLLIAGAGIPTDREGSQQDLTLPILLKVASGHIWNCNQSACDGCARLTLLDLPAAWVSAGGTNRPTAREIIRDTKEKRNAILHANYEQAGEKSGHGSVTDFFSNGGYAEAVNGLYLLTNALIKQIDSRQYDMVLSEPTDWSSVLCRGCKHSAHRHINETTPPHQTIMTSDGKLFLSPGMSPKVRCDFCKHECSMLITRKT